MKYLTEYIFCSKKLVSPLLEVREVFNAIEAVRWQPGKVEAISRTGKNICWQEAYNRLFELEFERIGGWQPQPVLSKKPYHKADFSKNDVMVEIQFGNSSTIFRDYYKFHLGLMYRLLSLSILILPTNQNEFFPSRNSKSSKNMATFEYALEHFNALNIPVPILLIGLLPKN